MAVELIIEVDLPGGDEAQKAVADLTAKLSKLGDERAALRKQLKELQQDEAKNAEAIKQTAAALAQNERETKKVRTEQQQFQKELMATRGSLNAQRAELSKLTRQYDQMSVGVNATADEMEAARKRIEDLTDSISKQEEATGRFQRNVGNYAGGIRDAFGQSGFSGALDAAKGGLMAVPQLAAAAFAVEGIMNAAKAIDAYAKEIQKTQGAIRALTGAEGDQLEQQAALIAALEDTYGEDFQANLVAVNSLSKQFNVSFEEAAKLVQQGFSAGANTQGEFLDILREYPTVLQDTTISAKEFVTIVTASQKGGFFSDSGIDAVKEAYLILSRDLNPAALSALKAVGLNGAEIQKQIKNGEITTLEAMQQVSNKLALLNPQTTEYGNLVTAIFGSAGENAGKFVRQLGSIQGLTTDAFSDQAFENARKAEELFQRLGDTTKGLGKFIADLKGYFLDLGATVLDLFEGKGGLKGRLQNYASLLTMGLVPAYEEATTATNANTEAQRKQAGALALLPPALSQTTKKKQDDTTATNQNTAAVKKNIETVASGLTLLDELTRERYRTIQAGMDMQVSQIGGGVSTDIAAPEAGTPPSVVQEISNARIAIAETEAETLGRIRREQYEADTQLWADRLEQANKYAGEVSTIAAGLSQVWAQNEANQLAQAGDNEAKQLEIKRKFAKRQAGISAVQAVISGLAGAQKTLETLGLPLAIPFLAAQTAITAANVAGIVKNAGQFYTGGYTGDGGKYEPAGVVHKGEFVVNKAATQAIGVDNLYRMQSAATGYANGGYVNAANATRPLNDAIAAAKFMPVPVVRVSDLQRVSGQMVRVNNNAR